MMRSSWQVCAGYAEIGDGLPWSVARQHPIRTTTIAPTVPRRVGCDLT
jgi:hypothetical protein